MAYVIAAPCIDVKDRACVDECPVDCIYEGPRMLYIQPDECVDCDACVPVCPVTAIFSEDDLPAEWKQIAQVNAEYFTEAVSGLGAPGGAAQAVPSACDHPVFPNWFFPMPPPASVAAAGRIFRSRRICSDASRREERLGDHR